jgi:hypothetical protein
MEFSGYASATAPDQLEGRPTYPGEETVTARYADVTAMNVRFELGDADFVIGKSGIALGVGDLYSPASGLEPANSNNPLHAFGMGLWQASINYYLPKNTVTLSVIPFDERQRQPAPGSRWLGDSGDISTFSLADLPLGAAATADIDVVEDFRSRKPKDWGYLAKLASVRTGYDFFGALYYGPSAYPVFRANVDLSVPTSPRVTAFKERPTVASASSGVTAVVDEWKIYGEIAIQFDAERSDPKRTDQDFAKLLVGTSVDAMDTAELLGVDSVVVTFEYARDYVINDFAPAGLRVSSESSRPYRDSLLGKIAVAINADVDVFFQGAVNFDDNDRNGIAGVEYKYSDDVRIFGRVQIFDGDPNTQFGRFRENDSVFVGTKVFF